jgi:serine/threonine-protein kinase
MEYVEGSPLPARVAAAEAVRLAEQIADALAMAHSKGVVHRDLKPSNILVTSAGVKLVDFGLAKLERPTPAVDCSTATETITETLKGTVAYMSPEQAQGKPLDARSDIFSFGLVLYEMLSGGHAFEGETSIATIAAILRDEPKALRAPKCLQDIVARCLRKSRTDRFQNMTEVKAALHAAVALLSAQRSSEGQPSIAVLPFANMSASKDAEYFSEGLAEEILNLLARNPGLMVTARTSSFAFRGKKQDITKIANKLNVRTVLDGSVRRAGNRVRVTARLINAADGYHLWSERYDREMTDVFALQDEIAAAIADALQVKFSAEPAASRRYQPSVPAYEAFLKARYYLGKFTPEDLFRGKECLEEAITLDPGFALAYSYLGRCFFFLAGNGLLPVHHAFPAARSAARKALEIDPSLAEALAVLGRVAAVYDYDWEEAGRQYRLAMGHEPVSPDVRCDYGYWYLLPMGYPMLAAEQYQRALEEDPLRLGSRVELAWCLQAGGMEAESMAQMRQALDLDENFAPALYGLALNYAIRGLFTEALVFAERAYSRAPRVPLWIGLFAGILVHTGESGRAERMLEKLRSEQPHGAPIGVLVFHLICSEVDKAAGWAETTIDNRDFRLIMSLPLTKGLRSSHYWPALARKMNLSERTIADA